MKIIYIIKTGQYSASEKVDSLEAFMDDVKAFIEKFGIEREVLDIQLHYDSEDLEIYKRLGINPRGGQ